MAKVELVPNRAYAGIKPQKIIAMCHDRTPFVTVRCQCGSEMHIHESFDPMAIADAMGAMAYCRSCREPLEFRPGFFKDAFQRMRDDGWID